MSGVSFGIEWASPGYYAYSSDWWLSISCGRGDFAGHAVVTLLGLSFAIRVYWPEK